MSRKWRIYRLVILSFLGSLLLSITFATPGLTHWADLAVAEILVGKTETQITLTFPTGLMVQQTKIEMVSSHRMKYASIK